MRKLIAFSLFFVSLLAVGQNTMTVVEKDSAESHYRIKDVSKVTFEQGAANIHVQKGYYDQYKQSNIQKVHFMDQVKGCLDPLAHNFNALASIKDSCKYVKLQKTDSIKEAIDTLASNPKDVCDTMDIKKTVESAKILSYLLFGKHIEVKWELKQNGKSVFIKAMYELPTNVPEGRVMFVLHVKCKGGASNKRTLSDGVTYQSFGDAILLGTTNTEEVEQVSASTLTAYPNPTSGIITLKYNLATGVNVVEASIVDMNGSVVRVIDANKLKDQGEYQVSMIGLTSGIYTVRISTGSNVLVQKIVKL